MHLHCFEPEMNLGWLILISLNVLMLSPSMMGQKLRAVPPSNDNFRLHSNIPSMMNQPHEGAVTSQEVFSFPC